MIPVPAPAGGVVLVAEDSVTYFRNGDEDPNSRISQAIDLCEIKTWAYVDPDGRRILLGDQAGQLYMLVLQLAADAVEGLSWEPLGQGSIPSSLAYLDSGVYVGSAQGDSQLIALSAEPEADSGNFFGAGELHQPGADRRLLRGGPRPAGAVPARDLFRRGKDGSLRLVRNGIGINESASIELPGVQGLWSLRESSGAAFDQFLVQSFVSETRMLMVKPAAGRYVREARPGSQEDDEEEEGDLEEGEIAGFDSESRTLLASNMASDTLLSDPDRGAAGLVRHPAVPLGLVGGGRHESSSRRALRPRSCWRPRAAGWCTWRCRSAKARWPSSKPASSRWSTRSLASASHPRTARRRAGGERLAGCGALDGDLAAAAAAALARDGAGAAGRRCHPAVRADLGLRGGADASLRPRRRAAPDIFAGHGERGTERQEEDLASAPSRLCSSPFQHGAGWRVLRVRPSHRRLQPERQAGLLQRQPKGHQLRVPLPARAFRPPRHLHLGGADHWHRR